jgi:hypothetical protein
MFYLGLDLGQRRDPSAIAVVEKTLVMRVRHLERFRLGTLYPDVVERVREITQHRELAGNCALAVDSTGATSGKPGNASRALLEKSVPAVLVRPDDEYYGRVEDYDPVLRAHCDKLPKGP